MAHSLQNQTQPTDSSISPDSHTTPHTEISHGNRVFRVAAIVLFAVFATIHLIAIFREGINWDEFPLLNRSLNSIHTGKLTTGGRPGLATLLLIPFANGAIDSITAVLNARVLWTLFTFGYLGGVYVLASRLAGDRRWSQAGFLAVALIAFVPLFQRWSLQVRSDNPALAFSTWGCVALLASRRKPLLGLVAGALFTVAFLFSQKAAYIIALGGLVSAGAEWIDGDLNLRRAVHRGAWTLASALALYCLYFVVASRFFDTGKSAATIAQLYDSMSYARNLGIRVYRHLPMLLIPHIGLLALLIVATIRQASHRDSDFRRCVVAWLVLLLGCAVLYVHGNRSAYFWMTLGIYPAIAIAVASKPIFEMFLPRTRHLVVTLATLLLVWRAAPMTEEVLVDTIDIQRRTLAFVDRNFPREARGFHPEQALFYREEPSPFARFYLFPIIRQIFIEDENGPANQANFISEFRSRPISFIIDSYRLGLFPPAIRNFWNNSYVRYSDGVLIAGRFLRGDAGKKVVFEVVVSGEYVLHVPEGHPPIRIAIGDRIVNLGDTVRLSPGQYEIELLDPVHFGMFTLRLDEPPRPDTYEPFYHLAAQAEVLGDRRWPLIPSAR